MGGRSRGSISPSCITLQAVSALWWIPLGLGVAIPGLLYLLDRQLTRGLAGLQESVAAVRALQPVVAQVRDQAEGTRRALESRHLR
jgi:hypothetical protein